MAESFAEIPVLNPISLHADLVNAVGKEKMCIRDSLWNDSKLKFHSTAEKYQNSYRFKQLLDKC